MRYSNVHESFLDFLKDKSNKEYKKTLERIQIFLKNNPQYGYETSTGLPGLCPLEKLSKSIVATEKHLKKVVKELNIENLVITRLSSKVWSGSVLLILPSSKMGTEYGKYVQNYKVDPFSSYLQQYDYGSYKPKRPRKQSGRYMYESIFSDFMDYLTGDKDMSKPEYNLDNAYVQVTRYLVEYPEFDYDKTTDTPGLIFLSTLSRNISVPMKAIEKLIKSKKLENADVVEISVQGIEGSVIVFGNAPYDRKELLQSWKSELAQTPKEELERMIDATQEIEQENISELPIQPPSEETSKEEQKEETTSNTKPSYEITDEENQKRKLEIVKETTDAIFTGVKRGQAKTPEQQRIFSLIESIKGNQEKRELIFNFVNNILDEIIGGNLQSISAQDLVNKILLKSKKVDGLFYYKESDGDFGKVLAKTINDNTEILNNFFTYISNSIKPEDKIVEEPSGEEMQSEKTESTEITSPSSEINVSEERAKQPKTNAEKVIRSSNFVAELNKQISNVESIMATPNKIQQKLIDKIKSSDKNMIIESFRSLLMNIFERKDSVYKNQLENVVMFPYDTNPLDFFFISDAKKGVSILIPIVFENYAIELFNLMNEN